MKNNNTAMYFEFLTSEGAGSVEARFIGKTQGKGKAWMVVLKHHVRPYTHRSHATLTRLIPSRVEISKSGEPVTVFYNHLLPYRLPLAKGKNTGLPLAWTWYFGTQEEALARFVEIASQAQKAENSHRNDYRFPIVPDNQEGRRNYVEFVTSRKNS